MISVKDEEVINEFRLIEREKMYEDYFRKQSELDKYLITVSTGTILLSVTFLEKIAQYPSKISLIILFGSWIALGFSLVFCILSYFWSLKIDDYTLKNEIYPLKKNDWIKEYYTHISFTLVLIGIFAMLIFSGINLSNREKSISTSNSNHVMALSVSNSITLYNSPNEKKGLRISSSNSEFKIKILKDNGEWLFVEYLDLSGWIEKKDISEIKVK